MKTGTIVKLNRKMRGHKTGKWLPMEGKLISKIENLGRELLLVNFGEGIIEYVFANEVKEAA